MIALARSLSVTGGLDLAAASRAFSLARSRTSSRLAISPNGRAPTGMAGVRIPIASAGAEVRAQIRMLHLSVVRRLLSPVSPKPNSCPHIRLPGSNRSHRSRNRFGKSRANAGLAGNAKKETPPARESAGGAQVCPASYATLALEKFLRVCPQTYSQSERGRPQCVQSLEARHLAFSGQTSACWGRSSPRVALTASVGESAPFRLRFGRS